MSFHWITSANSQVQFDNEPPENFNGLSESRVIQALLYEKKGFKLGSHTVVRIVVVPAEKAHTPDRHEQTFAFQDEDEW
jgi:hypothetical protein